MTENTVASRTNSIATRPVAANTRRHSRPTKAVLARLKVSAIIVAVATFAGSLGAIVVLNPGIKQASANTPTSSQVAPVNIIVPSEPAAPQVNSAPLQLPQPSQQSQLFTPRTRTRGS